MGDAHEVRNRLSLAGYETYSNNLALAGVLGTITGVEQAAEDGDECIVCASRTSAGEKHAKAPRHAQKSLLMLPLPWA